METFSRKTLDDSRISPWYITGFVEGDGSFTYSRTGSNNLNPYFAIKVTKQDDEILEQIMEYLAVGKIYEVKSSSPRYHSGYTKRSSYYRVSKQSELERVVQHFELFPLRGPKKDAFDVWKEIVTLKRAFRKPDLIELNNLAKRLSGITARNKKWDGDKNGISEDR